MLDQPKEIPLVLFECAQKFRVATIDPLWIKHTFEKLYDWYFVPRQPHVMEEAVKKIADSYAEFELMGVLPNWFLAASRHLFSEQSEIVCEEEYGTEDLDDLEALLHLAALEWFVHNHKKVGGMPSNEEICVGARSYAASFRAHRRLPWFMRLSKKNS